MKIIEHKTAKPSHYNQEAETYDLFNEAKSAILNKTVQDILTGQGVQTVLDMTCGTGSQVFWLTRAGFEVTGLDINAKMLKIARTKAQGAGLSLSFIKGDMRTSQVGKFDAVITLFNAVGHLTREDFGRAITNVANNLKPGGLYIFDIFNRTALEQGDRITDLTIDWLERQGEETRRIVQWSTLDHTGILASYQVSYTLGNTTPLKGKPSAQTLQIYGAHELEDMLALHGFRVLSHSAVDGSSCDETATERILTVAQWQGL